MILVQFADRKLSDGKYSDSFLAILDTEHNAWEEISKHYKVAIKNVGVSIPTE